MGMVENISLIPLKRSTFVLTTTLSRNAVLDESAQTLFLTEMFRGLSLTLRAFFDRKVTVSPKHSCRIATQLADHRISDIFR